MGTMTATTLILMRHAKSSWEEDVAEDFDRPLAPRGHDDARRMGAWLQTHDHLPQLILSSPALRAKATAEIVARELRSHAESEVMFDAKIYMAELPTLCRILRRAEQQCLLLVGHNPGMEQLVQYLVPTILEQIPHQKLMPTAAIYGVEFQDGWTSVAAGRGRYLFHQRPKALLEE